MRLYKNFYQLSMLTDEEIEQYKKEENVAVKKKLEEAIAKAKTDIVSDDIEVVKKAMGGVLFIDEAYELSGSKVSGGGGFGAEAIAALLKDMDDYRGQFCVIMAGYREPMENMIAVNPGFKSRVNTFIDFPDYSLDELYQITELMSKKAGYSIDVDAMNEILKILDLRISSERLMI